MSQTQTFGQTLVCVARPSSDLTEAAKRPVLSGGENVQAFHGGFRHGLAITSDRGKSPGIYGLTSSGDRRLVRRWDSPPVNVEGTWNGHDAVWYEYADASNIQYTVWMWHPGAAATQIGAPTSTTVAAGIGNVDYWPAVSDQYAAWVQAEKPGDGTATVRQVNFATGAVRVAARGHLGDVFYYQGRLMYGRTTKPGQLNTVTAVDPETLQPATVPPVLKSVRGGYAYEVEGNEVAWLTNQGATLNYSPTPEGPGIALLQFHADVNVGLSWPINLTNGTITGLGSQLRSDNEHGTWFVDTKRRIATLVPDAGASAGGENTFMSVLTPHAQSTMNIAIIPLDVLSQQHC